MARATYTDADRAKVYVVLTTNEGNVKRTARETGVPENTVRSWKKYFEENGPPDLEQVGEAATEYVADATRVANKALARMEEMIDAKEGTLAQVTTAYGVLRDKIDRANGLSLGQVEHKLSLPSPEEIRESLAALVAGTVEKARQRQSEIVDAEVVEQAPQALPPGRP